MDSVEQKIEFCDCEDCEKQENTEDVQTIIQNLEISDQLPLRDNSCELKETIYIMLECLYLVAYILTCSFQIHFSIKEEKMAWIVISLNTICVILAILIFFIIEINTLLGKSFKDKNSNKIAYVCYSLMLILEITISVVSFVYVNYIKYFLHLIFILLFVIKYFFIKQQH